MHALLLTLGSHGDIHPFIAIGRALIARGHRVTLATNPYFQAQIEGTKRTDGKDAVPVNRIAFARLGPHEDLRATIENHKVMHPLWGPMAIMRKLVLPAVPMIVARTRELIRDLRPDVVVFHPIVVGAPWACGLEAGDDVPVPTVTVNPSPLMWANPNDQAVLLPGRSHTPRPSAVKFDILMGRLFMRAFIDPGLNRHRKALGLPAASGIFHADAACGRANLGIWSPVFRPPLRGDPPGSIVTGFCWHDRDATQETPIAEIKSFLDAGPPPIVFALGSTGVHAPGRFFVHAVEATRMLNQRALLVIGRGQSPPSNMPPPAAPGAHAPIKAVQYAPFSAIFLRASVIVHHGGAGTTAQALRAGRPTLVTPMAHDQHDNAARVKRLGTSETLRHARVNPRRLATILRRLLTDASYTRAAKAIGPRIAAEDGAARAAEAIELAAAKEKPCIAPGS